MPLFFLIMRGEKWVFLNQIKITVFIMLSAREKKRSAEESNENKKSNIYCTLQRSIVDEFHS